MSAEARNECVGRFEHRSELPQRLGHEQAEDGGHGVTALEGRSRRLEQADAGQIPLGPVGEAAVAVGPRGEAGREAAEAAVAVVEEDGALDQEALPGAAEQNATVVAAQAHRVRLRWRDQEHQEARPRRTQPLCPPRPIALERATSTRACRASFGT